MIGDRAIISVCMFAIKGAIFVYPYHQPLPAEVLKSASARLLQGIRFGDNHRGTHGYEWFLHIQS